MQERGTPALRWLRALVLAVVAFGLGLVAHLSADGLVPGPAGLAVLFAVTTVGCVAFLARPAGAVRITTLVMAGQAFVHAGLTAAAGHAGESTLPRAVAARPPEPGPTSLDRHGSLYDAYLSEAHVRNGGTDQLVVPHWVQHLVDDLTGPHAAMAVAHLVAALLVGLWLSTGERALWAVIRLSRCALAAGVRFLCSVVSAAAPLLPPNDGPRLDDATARRPRTYLLATAHGRRAPPALLAV